MANYSCKMVEFNPGRGCYRTSMGFHFEGTDYYFQHGKKYPAIPGTNAGLKAFMESFRQEHQAESNEPLDHARPVFEFFEVVPKSAPATVEADEDPAPSATTESDEVAALKARIVELEAAASAAPAPAPVVEEPATSEPEPVIEATAPVVESATAPAPAPAPFQPQPRPIQPFDRDRGRRGGR